MSKARLKLASPEQRYAGLMNPALSGRELSVGMGSWTVSADERRGGVGVQGADSCLELMHPGVCPESGQVTKDVPNQGVNTKGSMACGLL